MRASPSYSGPKVRKGSTAVHPLSWEIGSSGWKAEVHMHAHSRTSCALPCATCSEFHRTGTISAKRFRSIPTPCARLC